METTQTTTPSPIHSAASPLILVVLPVYNDADFLAEAIRSILQQTFPDFQLLIIDDGSTDSSYTVAQQFQDPRILLWRQDNMGLAATLNRGLQWAESQNIPYVARMDADDISHPQRFASQLAFLEQHPEVGVCGCQAEYIDLHGNIIGTATTSQSHALIRWELFHNMRGVLHGAALFRTPLLAQVGGYRAELRVAEDIDLFLRLAEHTQLANCPESLFQIRLRNNSNSTHNAEWCARMCWYVIHCAHCRAQQRPEPSWEAFQKNMGWWVRLQIKKDVWVLQHWRASLHNQQSWRKWLAASLDPKRWILRTLRRLGF